MMPVNPHWFNLFLYIWLGLAGVIFILLVVLKIEVPYGRYTRTGWGSFIRNRAGWVLMEFPSLVVFSALFLAEGRKHDAVTWFFFAIWVFHYINRSLIYPFRIRPFSKKMPLSVMFMGIFFNLINASANGYYLGFLKPDYPDAWWKDIRFILGVMIYLFGVVANWWADGKLIRLRKNHDNEYKIPYGGLFRYVSCPNYLGEIMEWSGFALMAWNLPALAFAVWTFANLVPRALNHQAWYQRTFPAYPKERKALIPFIL
ncbi:MAG TPA: DUF1295 domain-containing protein [Bacteroidetes bacterium]|nr:DUF1295 domain-containing protein [Bacteroidota bacterium]